jgi:hypothetical protein
MATVGTLVRNPGVLPFPVTGASPAIIRGQAVAWDVGNFARPATTGDTRVIGIATTDSDTDLLQVYVAVRTWTVAVAIKTGDTPTVGQALYVDATTGKFTVTVGTGAFVAVVGYCVNAQPDANGLIEMAVPWF